MTPKDQRPKARLPRGLADRSAADIRASDAMIARIRRVYERYGFMPVETPMIEYTDALGKFLPDLDRPNEGVFSFQDDDEQWLSLRYDLTAPLARYVAENFERLPKPYRSYRFGWVFRNEKPGPGRFRQFMQFDADTVGAASPAADAEMCMMAADALEEVGIPRGQYLIKVNSRKVLDGVMEAIGVADERQKLSVLRAIDKYDRLGIDGVRLLLGPGRKDESGDFTKGAGLDSSAIDAIAGYFTGATLTESVSPRDAAEKPGDILTFGSDEGKRWHAQRTLKSSMQTVHQLQGRIGRSNPTLAAGVAELENVATLVEAAGYADGRIYVDLSVVRGLEYYTGAVFEAELLAKIPNEKGEPVVFGSVGGGGRYDGLVGRFTGADVPATGFSIGVSRLLAALTALGKVGAAEEHGPVVVLVLDRDRIGDYQAMVARLRRADIAAEMYLGDSGMRAQMKYADRRNAPLAIIQGGDEKARGIVQIKDLVAGKKASAAIADNKEWREERPGQEEVPEDQLVEAVNRMLGFGELRDP
jgi:histidyl-tRNA synthetase